MELELSTTMATSITVLPSVAVDVTLTSIVSNPSTPEIKVGISTVASPLTVSSDQLWVICASSVGYLSDQLEAMYSSMTFSASLSFFTCAAAAASTAPSSAC